MQKMVNELKGNNMECATTNALNKYQEKMRKQEVSLELLLSSIDDDLVEIQDLINKVKKRASDYDGLDFSEEVKSLLVELI